jgi:hypothetical protein
LPLPRTRILQVGDLHLPTAAKTARSADQKDPGFSIDLRNAISRQPIKAVFKRLYALLNSNSIDAVLLMGDMTDYGELKGYQAGVEYIANALQLGATRQHASVFTGIVPGNHDISRDLAKQPGLGAKFTPLKEALHKAGLAQIPAEHSVAACVGAADARCNVILMNSCWGCGAVGYIPQEFRQTVGDAIEAVLSTGDQKALRAYYDRQFDTPAFSENSVSNLVSALAENSDAELAIVVAHHNLLPQRLPRLAPYTELVNSGALRAALLEAKRPVLYLHGHIHTDPVEVLARPGGDVVVSISAPLAEKGFNILEVVFTKAGAPLALHIIPWVVDESGIVREGVRQTISLIGKRRRSLDRKLSQVYSYLLGIRQCYWQDLVVYCSGNLSSATEEDLQECIELLVADHSVSVENYNARPSSWIIEAKI